MIDNIDRTEMHHGLGENRGWFDTTSDSKLSHCLEVKRMCKQKSPHTLDWSTQTMTQGVLTPERAEYGAVPLVNRDFKCLETQVFRLCLTDR